MIIIETILGVGIYIFENGNLLKLDIKISTFIKNSNKPDKNFAKGKNTKAMQTTMVPKIVSGPKYYTYQKVSY